MKIIVETPEEYRQLVQLSIYLHNFTLVNEEENDFDFPDGYYEWEDNDPRSIEWNKKYEERNKELKKDIIVYEDFNGDYTETTRLPKNKDWVIGLDVDKVPMLNMFMHLYNDDIVIEKKYE